MNAMLLRQAARRRPWLMLPLLWMASAAAQVTDTVSEWGGTYSCATKPGFFSRPAEALRAPLRLSLRAGSLTGTRDDGPYMEKFHGSVSPGGVVTLVADGFWAGATQRSTTLSMTGHAGSVDMFLLGALAEKENGRVTRELDCSIMLTRQDTPESMARDNEERVRASAGLELAAVQQPVPAATPAAVASPDSPAGATAPLAAAPAAAAVPAGTAQAAPSAPAAAAAPAEAPSPAAPPPARRLALVIGNDAYRHAPVLANARADAQAMAAALGRLGFAVTLRLDLDERAFKAALRNFRAQVEHGDEVVVFFAGHGVQLGGANYLLPVDIRGEAEEQVKDESLPLQRVLDDFADRRAGFLLAIVDACRDNPFRSVTRAFARRGLAPTTAASGQMVIFSAGSGQQALDRLSPQDADPNGLFTRVFLREMEKPDLTIDRVLRNVRNEVVRLARTVGHEQTPALYDQAIGDFYFKRSSR